MADKKKNQTYVTSLLIGGIASIGGMWLTKYIYNKFNKKNKNSMKNVLAPINSIAEARLIDEELLENIDSYPDFPSEGVLFRDIFPIFRQPSLLTSLCRRLSSRIKSLKSNVTCIIGLDSRGFLLGPIIALDLGVKFVPIRKAGKLPGSVLSIQYSTEYSNDEFETQASSLCEGERIVIIDDVLATGGTMDASVQLCRKTRNVTIVECIVVIELLALKGRQRVDADLWSLFKF